MPSKSPHRPSVIWYHPPSKNRRPVELFVSKLTRHPGDTDEAHQLWSRYRKICAPDRGYAERFSASDGNFSHIAREHPEFKIDMPFLVGTIPNVRRLADAFRAAEGPVVYLVHVLKPDYSNAAFPYWRVGIEPARATVLTASRAHRGRRLSVT